MKDAYCYGCNLRPPSIGCVPKHDLMENIFYDGLFSDPDFGRTVYGRVYYSKPLSDDEVRSYELTPRK